MLVGRSGSMKSMCAMWYAHSTKLNTLYFSADQAAFHSITRLGSLLSGDPVKSIEAAIDADATDYYEPDFRKSRMDFNFLSSPTLVDMSDQLSAYVQTRNAYPDLILIDTLNNVDALTDDKYGGLTLIEKELHRMARETGAGILVVHHTLTKSDKPFPPGKSEIDGKIDKLAERIVSVALDPKSMEFKIACIKNRDGKCDPSGETYVSLTADPDRARFLPFNRYGGW